MSGLTGERLIVEAELRRDLKAFQRRHKAMFLTAKLQFFLFFMLFYNFIV